MLKLEDGEDEATGRVHIFLEGEWGTICDDNFGDMDAAIICRQLGFVAGTARVGGTYGKGKGPIWMNNLDCEGTEDNVMECAKNFRWNGEWGCTHQEDAGVACSSYGNVLILFKAIV